VHIDCAAASRQYCAHYNSGSCRFCCNFRKLAYSYKYITNFSSLLTRLMMENSVRCPNSSISPITNIFLPHLEKLFKASSACFKEAGLEFKGTIEAKHLLQLLKEDVGIDNIKASVINPLTNLKVAEHNGCHILRPKEFIGFDDPEDPQTLKSLIEATGATCLDYMDETECCGAPSVGVNDTIALNLARDKLNNIKTVGAQALITICPFCHIMYDTNELRIEKMFNETYGIPVLHYPQLLGLAMGIPPEELAFSELRVDSSKIIKQICEVKTNA
jgi:heterodisulfide reductase subunit B